MQLDNLQITRIDEAIYKSNIPFEDVKLELVDHLATMIEIKMEDNPRMSFETAYEIASVNAKNTIYNIRDAIRKDTIQNMVKSVFDFSGLVNVGLLMLGAGISFSFLYEARMGLFVIMFAYIFFAITSLLILWIRLRKINVTKNYSLQIMKQFSWTPIISAAGFGIILSTFLFIVLGYGSYFSMLTKIKYLGISFGCGFLFKAIFESLFFNIHKLKEGNEINEMFFPENLNIELV